MCIRDRAKSNLKTFQKGLQDWVRGHMKESKQLSQEFAVKMDIRHQLLDKQVKLLV